MALLPNRRSFLRHLLLLAATLLAVGGTGFLPRIGKTKSLLRPPGALPEDSFIAQCIRCGRCVQVCPVKAIHLLDLDQGVGLGTPFMVAREQSCGFFCDHLSCVKACPTGALREKVIRLPKTHSRMGKAVLAHPQQCLAGQGKSFHGLARTERFRGVLRNKRAAGWQTRTLDKEYYNRALCDLCVIECPIPRAIALEASIDTVSGQKKRLPQVTDKCLGCGVCEMVCPTNTASIRVIPQMELEQKW